jgi:MFS family permease
LAQLRHARLIVAVFVTQRFVRGMLTVLVVAAAIELLAMGEAGVGALSSAVGLGGLVGGAAALGLVSRTRLVPWFLVGVVAWGIGIGLPGAVPIAPLAGLALAFAGAGKVILDVAGFSLLQRTVPAEARPRVLGALEGFVTAALAGGSIAAAWLVDAVGAGGALVAAGGLPVAVAALAWLPLRRADDEAVIPERELRLLRQVPLFRPLRLNSLELLAGAVDWTAVGPGEAVVREDEYGDRFYVIESGRFEVVANGVRRREMAAGESFGEIALLHARPRTATVVALEPGVLASIDGEAFLAVVTAHEESAAAAEAQAADRLCAVAVG